ncbi:MAG: type II secretion system protein GspK [Planctomycetota bacterium]|nr:type II secretion system protein GspK [Planctomycetota bacterium]
MSPARRTGSGGADSLNDSWAEPKPPYEPPFTCTVKVQDESGKFNVNMLAVGDGVNIPLKNSLERLFLDMDINIEAVHRIVDYIDPDSEGEFEDGAINQPLRHLTQLLDIEYITPEVFFSRGEGEEKELGLVDLLTLHSNGRVNVNTAPRKVIMALFNKTEGELGAFDDYRELNVIKDVEELVPLGMINAREVAPIVGYRSDFFRIISVAKSERIKKTVECLVVRGSRQIEVIERRQF